MEVVQYRPHRVTVRTKHKCSIMDASILAQCLAHSKALNKFIIMSLLSSKLYEWLPIGYWIKSRVLWELSSHRLSLQLSLFQHSSMGSLSLMIRASLFIEQHPQRQHTHSFSPSGLCAHIISSEQPLWLPSTRVPMLTNPLTGNFITLWTLYFSPSHSIDK